jgi:UDP-4-amino-4,6-dideoxy-N-acetyl-beta-L-altrosamine N-acetyltransferase
MITGQKIFLKGVTKDESMLIYDWVNREELRALTGTQYPVSEYEHEEWIKRIATATDKKLFLICDKASDRAIGTIGLKNFDYTARKVELFISIGEPDFISGGYGSDAVKTLVDYCFNSLNLHKIFLRVYESNQRAIRCYEKVGFEKEGTLRDEHFSSGKYENVIIMGILSKGQ